MIYIIIFFVIFYGVYVYDIKGHCKNKDQLYWTICVIFIIVSGLRYKIGGDTLGYMETWKLYPNIWNFNWFYDIEQTKAFYPELERHRYGWFIYVMFLKGIVNDYYILQICNAVILNIAIFKTINKYSYYPFITLLILYFNFKFFELEFEVMRECIAVSVYLLIAFDHYVNKKWIKYYIGTIIAYLIHPSAIAMFILPIFRYINWNFKAYTIIFVVTSLTIGVAGRIILGNILNIIGGEGYTAEYALKAIGKEYNIGYILMYLFQPMLLYSLVLIFRTKIKQSCFTSIIFFTIFLLNLALLYFTASRLANYVIIIVYIAISPIFYYIIKISHTVWIAVLLLAIYLTPTIYQFSADPLSMARYFPYQTFIFPDQTKAQKEFERWHLIN